MLRRCLAATLSLLILAGFGLAETFHGLLAELTDSKLTIVAREEGGKPEKKTLDVGSNVRVSQPKGDGEKLLPFAEVQKFVKAATEQKFAGGVLASVSTDGAGQVVAIKLGKGGLPEKAARTNGWKVIPPEERSRPRSSDRSGLPGGLLFEAKYFSARFPGADPADEEEEQSQERQEDEVKVAQPRDQARLGRVLRVIINDAILTGWSDLC